MLNIWVQERLAGRRSRKEEKMLPLFLSGGIHRDSAFYPPLVLEDGEPEREAPKTIHMGFHSEDIQRDEEAHFSVLGKVEVNRNMASPCIKNLGKMILAGDYSNYHHYVSYGHICTT